MTEPHNRDAEEALLACAWHQPALTESLGIQPNHFHGTDTEALWYALTALHSDHIDPDPVVALQRIPKQLRPAANDLILTIVAGHPAIGANAPTYAAEILALHRRRTLLTATNIARIALQDPDATPTQIDQAVAAITQASDNPDPTTSDWRRSFITGGAFVFDHGDEPTPLWGTPGRALWVEGESLIIVGTQGTGKTTLAQQLGLGSIGLPNRNELLDLPIQPTQNNLLYLAMDRPAQARRSLRRMVSETDRAEMDARFVVWGGPPPQDLARDPDLLTRMCHTTGADRCIVDSLKDAFLGLTDDEAAAAWNRARQTALRAGIQLVELHHNRKAPAGVKAEQPTISDVYGSTWITSGAGSVILLHGAPGDPIVKAYHLKQPSEEVGPLSIIHDHDTGTSTIWHGVDLVVVAKARGRLTAQDAASILYETDKPTPAEREKARRRLDKLTETGLMVVVDPGDKGTRRPRTWGAATRPSPPNGLHHADITRPPSANNITTTSHTSRDSDLTRENEHHADITNITHPATSRDGGSLYKDPHARAAQPNDSEPNQTELPNLPTCTRCGNPVDPGRRLCHTCAQAEAIAHHQQRLTGTTDPSPRPTTPEPIPPINNHGGQMPPFPEPPF